MEYYLVLKKRMNSDTHYNMGELCMLLKEPSDKNNFMISFI